MTCVYHQNKQHVELRLEMVVFRRGSCDMCISSEYKTHDLRLEMVVFRRGSCDMCISSEYTTHGA